MSGLWEVANKVSEIGYKIDSLAGISELVAERLVDNAESGACWTIAEMLREYGDKLEILSSEIMLINKALNAQVKEEPKKAKKK